MSEAIVEVDEFTAEILVPSPGDDRKAASVEVPFQALANRTKNLKGILDDFEGEEHEWAVGNTFLSGLSLGTNGGDREVEYTNTRVRKVLLPLRPVIIPSGWAASADSQGWQTTGTQPLTFWVGRDELPSGAVLTAVRAGVSLSALGTLSLVRMSPGTSPVGPYVALGSPATDAFTPAGTEAVVLAITGIAYTIDNSQRLVRIKLDPTSGVTALYWLELEYEDPGPRNF